MERPIVVDDPDILLATRRFRVVRRSTHSPDGQVHTREIIEHPGAVAIVPLVDAGRVCLIRNFRASVGRWLIEIPAGTLEAGEDPLDTARRELAEETGYVAGRMEPLAQLLMSPGILHERMHLYVASELRAGPPHLEAGEQIESLLVDWDEALGMIHTGQIEDAKTIAALMYCDRWQRPAPSATRPQRG